LLLGFGRRSCDIRFGIGQRGTCLIWGLLAALLVQLWAPAAARGEGACPGESDHFAGGNGSEACPYLIANPDHLNNVRNELGAHYRLIDDIDLAGTPYVNWGPIGSEGNPFTGKLDGGGHKISNLTIDRPDQDYVGLFGVTGSGAVIRNLGLENVNVTGHDYVGGLVGSSSGTITDSYAKGSVTANSSAGGLVGNNAGTIMSSYATGTVMTDDRYAGGLVGTNSGTIERSFAAALLQEITMLADWWEQVPRRMRNPSSRIPTLPGHSIAMAVGLSAR